MAEFLRSKCLDVLFDRLLSSDLLKFARREGIREELDKWRKTMERIREVLDDAEEQQRTKKTVKDWLDDLRDLLYDMEDLLDEFATEANLDERKLMAGESQASASMVRNLIPSWITAFTPSAVPSAVKFNIRLGSKIEKINKRFNDLVRQKDQLNLKENVSPRPSKRRKISPPTSVVTEDHIYGREEVAKAVLQLLISDKHSDHALTKVPNVIPIVGMGGIGKTTLAQLVYNNEKVDSFFDLKAWACVSEDFDVAAITKTILQSLTSENCDGKDLNWLQVKLKKKLLGKRFLVILDDVWNENYNDWTLLRAPFEAGAQGSSIIVTTRNQGVSSLMRNKEVKPFQLELLSEDACLSIFSQHALDARDFSAHPDLKDIGVELVKRCKHSPLAVKTIAGVLRSEDEDRNEWEKVLKNKIWDISMEENGIPSSLMVSYDNLPSHLKRCFAYCSILPKDYEFKEKEVVLLWMAEGLIQPLQDHEEEMEDLGSKYFRNLLSRSFFQQSRIFKSQFTMHDLINDLAQSVAGDTCYRMEDKHETIPIKARHSSYLGSHYDVTKKFEVFSKLTSSLRTFLPLMLPLDECYLAYHVPFELVPTLRCLRVLSFNGYYITELPDSIGDLKHLRYLDLSETRIRLLPESITSLYNLQTLLLENCIRLKKLPLMFRNLVNLRHLNIEGADSLEGMPMQIGKLTCLQTLSKIVLGKDSCSGIKELGPLKHLRGTLCISGLENVIEPKDAKDAELIKKTKISELSLEWSWDIDESKDRTSELEVLNELRPHDALMDLSIINYGGTRFPNWLASPSFTRMVSLTLQNCYKCTSLPPLAQYLSSLENLSIKGMAKVKSVGSEFCGSNLESLNFEDMEEWEDWSPCEEFPNLISLYLRKCPKLLGKLPKNLPLLDIVEIIDCAQLVVSISCFPDKCKFNMEGVVCGSKATFESMRLFRPVSPISDEGLDMEGLEWLRIESWEELTTLWSDNKGSLPHDLPFLKSLNISNCPKLVSLVAEEVDQELLQLRITSINIQKCIALESLPKALMYNNTCLQSIYINNCDSLTHFARSHLPPTLKKLCISYCRSMRNLVEDDDNDTNNSTTCSSGITSLLEVLNVINCPSLESLTSSGELPATLQQLTISDCKNLQLLLLPSNLRELCICGCEKILGLQNGIQILTSLQYLKILQGLDMEGLAEIDQERLQPSLPKALMYNNTCLQCITISRCDSLTHFARSHLPPTLKKLRIWSCKSMRNLVEDDDNDTNNSTTCSGGITSLLEELEVKNCPSLESLTSSGKLPTTLQSLFIYECPKLESVAKSFHHNSFLTTISINRCENLQLLLLPSNLRQLQIIRCEKMQGLQNGIHNVTSLRDLHIVHCPSILSFPKEGFPTNLTYLRISCLKITEALFHWGLENLTSLNELEIHGCQHLVSFPEMMLPPSLRILRISEFSNLECLSSEGLRKLTSLKTLQISCCEKLTCFPKNSLPPSLQKLQICECPLLEERCKKDPRGEWRRIADIPYVQINRKYIYDTETEE